MCLKVETLDWSRSSNTINDFILFLLILIATTASLYFTSSTGCGFVCSGFPLNRITENPDLMYLYVFIYHVNKFFSYSDS